MTRQLIEDLLRGSPTFTADPETVFGREPDAVEGGENHAVAVFHLRTPEERIRDITKRSDPDATIGGPRTVKCIQYVSDGGWDVLELELEA